MMNANVLLLKESLPISAFSQLFWIELRMYSLLLMKDRRQVAALLMSAMSVGTFPRLPLEPQLSSREVQRIVGNGQLLEGQPSEPNRSLTRRRYLHLLPLIFILIPH